MYVRLSNATWERIEPFLAKHPLVRLGSSTRTFLQAVLWILRTGSQWRALPAELGLWNTVFKRFRRWVEREIFEDLLDYLSREADCEFVSVDSTTARAHMSAAGAPSSAGGQQHQSLGRSRGGFSTKIHVKTDALGLPLKLTLTAGHRGDMVGVWDVLEPEDRCASALLADRAYDSSKLRQRLEQIGVQAVIPCSASRAQKIEYDKDLYKERHGVDCFINKIKWFRRVDTRYDRLDKTYLGFIHFASCMIWLR